MQQDNPSQSLLLRCLSSLDVDIWAEVLLPKLISQGSAGDVALACSQLRDLCFGAVQHINLSTVLDSSSSAVEDWVQTIPQHFTACKSVELYLDDDDSYHTTAYLVPALARLPHLDSVELRARGGPRPLAMGTVLYSLRTQLAGRVRSLHLDLRQSWAGAAQAWRELGKHTGLAKLVLIFDDRVEAPLDRQDLLPLANLLSLEELAICSRSRTFFQPYLSPELAASLTALTYLELGGCEVSCLAHVSSCVSLQMLVMECPDGNEQELGPSEWAAVGALEALDKLLLYNAKFLAPSEECCAAISKLTKLRVFGAEVWSVDMLSAIAASTQLDMLAGGWQHGSSSAEGVVLPGVVALTMTYGSPPFAALPNLVTVQHMGPLEPDAFIAMARHCSRLERLEVAKNPKEVVSLPGTLSRRECVSALSALSALSSLTEIGFMAGRPSEVMALVDLVSTLLPRGFQLLQVVAVGDSRVVFCCLMHLAKLQGLPELVLQVHGDLADAMARYADVFVSALSGIGHVQILGLEGDQADEVLAALDHLRESGLPCPKKLEVFC